METKLTLSIESNLAQIVNGYAKKKGCTLSNLVENYFWAIVKSEEADKTNLTAPVANALFGSLKAPDNTDYKEELTAFMTEKYL